MKKIFIILLVVLSLVGKPVISALAKSPDSCVTFHGTYGDTVYYICSANGIPLDMGELCKTVNLLLCGKGGGRGTLAQGSAPARGDLEESAQQLRRYCTQIV